ncbi:hypothetical protein [Neisseria sp. S1]|uniref:hypothetical protein n=1 Tax=Neisseria sp. S1 TaxID=3318354 RepID=UPI003A8B89D9
MATKASNKKAAEPKVTETSVGELPQEAEAIESAEVSPVESAETFKAKEVEIEYLEVTTKHDEPYRRCGRVFGVEVTRLEFDELTTEEVERLAEDPHLIVHFISKDE